MDMCLFNTRSKNVAGYCKKHRCNVTVKQMRCKNCLRKGCWHLVKNEQHPFWAQKNNIKQKRKDRKRAIDEYVRAVQSC